MLHEVRAFDKLCSVETYGVGVEEHVNIFFLLDATLHYLDARRKGLRTMRYTSEARLLR